MKATYIDLVLFICVMVAGLISPNAFGKLFLIAMPFWLLHLCLSKVTLKPLRELIINKFIEGND